MLPSVHTADGRRGGTTWKSVNHNILELTSPGQQLHDPNQNKNLPVYCKRKCIYTNQRRGVYATRCVVRAGRRSWGTIVFSQKRTERKDLKIVGTRPALGLGVIPSERAFFRGNRTELFKKVEIRSALAVDPAHFLHTQYVGLLDRCDIIIFQCKIVLDYYLTLNSLLKLLLSLN